MNPPKFIRKFVSKYFDITHVKKFIKSEKSIKNINKCDVRPCVGDITNIEYIQESSALNKLLMWNEQLGSFDLIYAESMKNGNYYTLQNFRVNQLVYQLSDKYINSLTIFDITKDMTDYIYNMMRSKNVSYIEGRISEIDKIIWSALGYTTDLYRTNCISAYVYEIECGRNYIQIISQSPSDKIQEKSNNEV
jgi:hypothetical protein